jgi:hypothetical protein
MSDENVEIVKRAADAFNARDLETWATFFDPAFEFVDHMGAVARSRVRASRPSAAKPKDGWRLSRTSGQRRRTWSTPATAS